MKQSTSTKGAKGSLSTRFRSAFSRVDWSAFCDLFAMCLLLFITFGGISFAMFGIGNWLLGWFCGIVCVIVCALLVYIEHETIIKNK